MDNTMYVIHNINDYNDRYVNFNSSILNTVIDKGKFSRLIYSTNLYTINSLLFNIKFSKIKAEYNYTKYKCFFSVNDNKHTINKICNIERNILDSFKSNKKRNLSIGQQLKSGSVKLFDQNKYVSVKEIILKISGIWETATDIGITYKFMLLTPSS